MSPLESTITLAVGSLVMLAVPGYFPLQIWVPIKFSGGWRTAALAPLVLAVPSLVWCAFALAEQSNLWPMTFILFAPFGSAYLALIYFLGRGRQAA